MRTEKGAYSPEQYDEMAVRKHLLNALTLIDRNDVQDRAVTPAVGRKTQVEYQGSDLWRIRVIDARPWESGRPESGEPRFYDVRITFACVTPKPDPGAGR